MNFSSPALLWALPAAAAPLVIHLLSLRRARRVAFSDLTLLRRAYAAALPKTRLRSWLLLASRCVLILLFIAAYAGPVLPTASGRSAAAAEDGLDLVVLLDASYSMGYRENGKTRFDMARAAGEEVVRSLKPIDRVAVGVFSDRWESPAGGLSWNEKREALDILARARLGYRGTDYPAALKAAYERAAGSHGRRRAVLVLGDGARHGLAVGAPWPPLDPEVSLLGVQWAAGSGNGFISSVSLGEGAENRGRIVAAVKSAGLNSPSAAELWLGGSPAASEALTLEAGREKMVSFPLPSPKNPDAPMWAGRVSLRPDALSGDDSFYFSFARPNRPRVLVLYGNPDFFKALTGGYFLKELLGGAKDSLLDYDADFMELSRLPEAALGRYQAVVLADFKDVPAQAAAELDGFVRRGGGLWILPGSRGGAASFKAMDAWLPASVGEPIVAWEAKGLHNVHSNFQDFDLGRVAVARYHKLAPKPGAKIWMTSFSGDPLLVVGSREKGKVVLWASALDTAWSNLALKPVFTAWVHAILREIAPADARRESLLKTVGQPIALTWDASQAAASRVRVRDPAGRVTALWVKDRRVEYRETGEPGLYWVSEDGGTSSPAAYAVNLDRSRESDLSPLEPPPWKTLRLESLRDDLRQAVYGRDVRPHALGAALLFLVLEMLLSLPAGRQSRAPAAAIAALLIFGLTAPARAQPAEAGQGDRFVWSQLKLEPGWDPYPTAPSDVLEFLSSITSVLTYPERRVLTLKDPLLFSSPFLVLAGRQAPPPLDDEDKGNLRDYLSAGGTLWIEDTSGAAASSFDRWVREALGTALPEAQLAALEPDHVVYRTFFLLKGPAGRAMVRGSLEGVQWGGRTAVIYSRNDILGAWAKDALGRPLFACTPGGEPQRHNARKLALNILMYSLTGSYKADAVHQPYLLQKMRSGVP